MYDIVGGGFARYSTDNNWLVPHFEKMLYDNAQLARVYLHAHLLTGEPQFRRVTEETLDFILRDLYHPEGGFYSSLDADSEGEEGKYYVWTLDQIRLALPDPLDSQLVSAAYAVTESGNFDGSNVLQRKLADDELADRFNLSTTDITTRLQRCHAALLQARQQRTPPGKDDKVLTAWNALALQVFSEAGRYLNRQDYLDVATRNAQFMVGRLYTGDRLLRSWRDGTARHNAYLEDYASLILALLSLYQSTFDNLWYTWADRLTREMISAFTDADWGFFDTRSDQELLVIRPKDLQDNATPCGNSLAAMALFQMSAYTGEAAWRELAERSLASMQETAARYPTAFANWLCAADFVFSDNRAVAIIGDPQDPARLQLVEALFAKFRPNLIAAASNSPLPDGSPPLLLGRQTVRGAPAAYVCKDFVCKLPVTRPDELLQQLEN